MSSYQNLKEWRKNTKQKLIEGFGGKCQICDYNKSNSALEFHHINPAEKDFSISNFIGNGVKPWNDFVNEVAKCILLCANCHREVHEGLTLIPENYQRFDESLIVSHKKKPEDTPCIHCGNLKDYKQKFCSHTCSTTFNSKLKLNKEDLEKLLIEYKGNLSQISKVLNISDNGFKKKCLKVQLDPRAYR